MHADVRRAGGAERADGVDHRAALHFERVELPRAARPAGRQRSIRSHTRCVPSRREIPVCPATHCMSSIRATVRPFVQPPVDSHPDVGPVVDLARPQRALVPQPLEDVRAELRLAVPPGPVAAVARLVHPEAVDLAGPR